jgi:tripeptide aminopeptidase
MNKDRLTDLFIRLTQIDSLSFGEREMANVLKVELEDLGFEVYEDDAGSRLGSDTGNLYALLKATDPGKKPVLFSAHMDTVVPGIGKRAVIDSEKGLIRSEGDTILGADDAAGVAQILEAVRSTLESGAPHGDIEILFPVAEEVYGLGSAEFDYSRIISNEAFVIDLSDDIGVAAVAAPSIISFEFEITGRPAHAGFEPEAGINAIASAAEIIAATKQGRIAEGLTLNIGTIKGGSITNIVSESCVCTGEVRGNDHDATCAALDELKKTVDSICAKNGARYTFTSDAKIRAYCTPEDSDVCKSFAAVCLSMGLEPKFITTRGGSDNNVFAQHGLQGIVVGFGSRETHTTDEYIMLDDLYKGAELVENIIAQR